MSKDRFPPIPKSVYLPIPRKHPLELENHNLQVELRRLQHQLKQKDSLVHVALKHLGVRPAKQHDTENYQPIHKSPKFFYKYNEPKGIPSSAYSCHECGCKHHVQDNSEFAYEFSKNLSLQSALRQAQSWPNVNNHINNEHISDVHKDDDHEDDQSFNAGTFGGTTAQESLENTFEAGSTADEHINITNTEEQQNIIYKITYFSEDLKIMQLMSLHNTLQKLDDLEDVSLDLLDSHSNLLLTVKRIGKSEKCKSTENQRVNSTESLQSSVSSDDETIVPDCELNDNELSNAGSSRGDGNLESHVSDTGSTSIKTENFESNEFPQSGNKQKSDRTLKTNEVDQPDDMSNTSTTSHYIELYEIHKPDCSQAHRNLKKHLFCVSITDGKSDESLSDSSSTTSNSTLKSDEIKKRKKTETLYLFDSEVRSNGETYVLKNRK